jgi:hypothetical protein
MSPASEYPAVGRGAGEPTVTGFLFAVHDTATSAKSVTTMMFKFENIARGIGFRKTFLCFWVNALIGRYLYYKPFPAERSKKPSLMP